MDLAFNTKIFKNSPFAYSLCKIVYDDNSSITDLLIDECNTLFSDIFNLPASEIINIKASRIFTDTAEEKKEWINKLKTIELLPNTTFQYTISKLNKQVEISLYSPEKGIAVLLVKDISKQIKEKEIIAEKLKKFEILYDNSPDMYVSVSPIDATIKLCNRTFLEKTGYSKEEVIGHQIFEMYHEDCIDKVHEAFQQFVKYGKVVQKELIIRRKDGDKIYVSLNVDAIRDENGKILYSISTWRDINEKIETQHVVDETQNLLKNTTDSIPAYIAVVDAETLQYKFVNKAFVKSFNLTKEQIVGTHISDIIGKEKFEFALKYINEVKKGNATSYINTFKIAEGSRSINVTYTPGIDNEGTVKDIIVMSYDITKLKHTEEALSESEAQKRAILNGISAAIAFVNPNYEIIWANNSAQKISKEKVSLIGKKCFNVLKGETVPCKDCSCREVIKHSQRKQKLQTSKDGKIWKELAEPVFDEHNNLLGVVIISEDITEQVKTEIQLKENQKILENNNLEKDKFLSIIAHDLKSPFSSMIGILEMIEAEFNNLPSEMILKYISLVNQNAQKTYHLLENLLIWSRSKRGSITFLPKSVSLLDITNNIIELLQQSAQNKKITIQNRISPDTYAYADVNMLETVLRNLLSNAIKFSHLNGFIIISASIENIDNKNQIIVNIKDNGTGIEKENLNKLFNVTEMVSSPGTQNEKGSGLGLILCKEFIDKHNGKIWVESVLEKGSVFHFSLPHEVDDNNEVKN